MQIYSLAPITVLQRRERLSIAQIAAQAGPACTALRAEAEARDLVVNGPMIFQAWQMPQDAHGEFELNFCLPVAGGDQQLPALQCASTIHEGPLDELFSRGYRPLLEAIAAAGLRPTGESREVYHRWNGPEATDNRIEIQIGVAP